MQFLFTQSGFLLTSRKLRGIAAKALGVSVPYALFLNAPKASPNCCVSISSSFRALMQYPISDQDQAQHASPLADYQGRSDRGQNQSE